MTTHLHLVWTLRICGDISPLPICLYGTQRYNFILNAHKRRVTPQILYANKNEMWKRKLRARKFWGFQSHVAEDSIFPEYGAASPVLYTAHLYNLNLTGNIIDKERHEQVIHPLDHLCNFYKHFHCLSTFIITLNVPAVAKTISRTLPV